MLRMLLQSYALGLLFPIACQAETVHALLIGVTEYEHFPSKFDLLGPSQDVAVFHDLLTERFEVAPEHIIALTQSANEDLKPTYANIKREYEKLAKRVKPGDHVVILHSGHGSQDIDDDPDNPEDLEVDGLDEVFLPSDAKEWNGGIGRVENAVRDDQIREWLNVIRDRGASVFFISDSCNSESSTRAVDESEFRSRQIDLLPSDVRASVDRRDAGTRGGDVSGEDSAETITQNGIAAFYAARSGQSTPDGFRDPITGDKRNLGLLVYTINRILRGTERPITYRELGQRIQSEYVRYRYAGSGGEYKPLGVGVPDPVFEGPDMDREVLGNAWREGRSRIRFSHRQGRLYLTCTRLDGTMPGSILKLYPESGVASSEHQVGWAKIVEAHMDECIAVPVEYSDDSEQWVAIGNPEKLPARGRCEVHSLHFGAIRIPIMIDSSADVPEIHDAVKKLSRGTTQYLDVREDSASFRLLTKPNQSSTIGNQVLVLERTVDDGGIPIVSRFDLGPVDQHLDERLKTACKRILKTIALRETAHDMQLISPASGDLSALRVDVTAETLNQRDAAEGQPMSDGMIPLGKFVRFIIANRSGRNVQVNALYLADDYKIYQVFPRRNGPTSLSGDEENPASKFTATFPVENPTRAVENLIVIATPDGEPNGAFDYLAQDPLQALWLPSARDARGDMDRLRGGRTKGTLGPGSRLAEMLESSLFQFGGTRSGIGDEVMPTCSMSLISWRVADNRRVRVADSTTDARKRFDAANLRRGTDAWNPSVAESALRGTGESVYPRVAPAVVVVRTDSGHGTGFFISSDGWLLTNHHVVEDCSIDPQTGNYVATVHYGQLDGQWMKLADQPLIADVYRWSEQKDLALLKVRNVPPSVGKLPHIKFASKPAVAGSDCVAIGHPASGVLWTLRSGEVSGRGTWPQNRIDAELERLSLTGSDRQQLEHTLTNSPQREVLLSTCGLNPGDSGGPLVNEAGELIAVSFAIPLLDLERGVSLDKFSYHVNLSEVKDFLRGMPDLPLQWQPDLWAAASSYRLVDFNSNGRDDVLVLGDSTNSDSAMLLFDLDENSASLTFTDGTTLNDIQNAWDAEFAVSIDGNTAFYDTDNDGTMDLYLSDNESDGKADKRMRLSNQRWVGEPIGAMRMSVLDARHFNDGVPASVTSAFADAVRSLTGGNGSNPKQTPSGDQPYSDPKSYRDSPKGGSSTPGQQPGEGGGNRTPLNKIGTGGDE